MNKKIILTSLPLFLLSSCTKTERNTEKYKKNGYYMWKNKYDSFEEMVNAEKDYKARNIGFPLGANYVVFPFEIVSYEAEYAIRGVCPCRVVLYDGSPEFHHQDGEICEYLFGRTFLITYSKANLKVTFYYKFVDELNEETFVDLHWHLHDTDNRDYALENSKGENLCELYFSKQWTDENRQFVFDTISEACRYDNLVDFNY